MKFIKFRGKDILQRQIFYFYLNKINFYDIDNDHLSDNLIIYITNYIKNNIKSYDRILLVIFADSVNLELNRKNYPGLYFIKTVMSIISSDSVRSYIDINSLEVAVYKPSFMFKFYLYFLRSFYISKEVWSQVQFCESEENMREVYDIEVEEENK